MPRGDKDKYTEKQKRKAEHIEDSYEKKGVSKDEAEKRAWATVNKQSGGGERAGGAGTRKSQSEKRESREDSAQQAANTRRRAAKSSQKNSGNKTAGGNNKGGETKQALLEKARAKNIPGRSKMTKEQLSDALKKAHS